MRRRGADAHLSGNGANIGSIIQLMDTEARLP